MICCYATRTRTAVLQWPMSITFSLVRNICVLNDYHSVLTEAKSVPVTVTVIKCNVTAEVCTQVTTNNITCDAVQPGTSVSWKSRLQDILWDIRILLPNYRVSHAKRCIFQVLPRAKCSKLGEVIGQLCSGLCGSLEMISYVRWYGSRWQNYR